MNCLPISAPQGSGCGGGQYIGNCFTSWSEQVPLAPALLHNDGRAQEEAQSVTVLWRLLFPNFFSAQDFVDAVTWNEQYPLLHATDFLNSWLAGHTEIPRIPPMQWRG